MKKKPMTKAELIAALKLLKKSGDTEEAHINADHLLFSFIGDAEVTKAFNDLDKWYS